jgi:hypothetical protein
MQDKAQGYEFIRLTRIILDDFAKDCFNVSCKFDKIEKP